MVNDYEIVPEKEFDSLRTDVDKIKANPFGNSAEGKALKESIDQLNNSINNLLFMFKDAATSIKTESHDSEVMSKKMLPLFDKVERLSEQNEKIAKGIVALADMVEELKSKQAVQEQTPQKPVEQRQRPSYEQPSFGGGMNPMGLPPMPTPQQMPPPKFGDDFPSFGQGPMGGPLPRMDMPPMQEQPKKKLFGFK